MFAYFYTLDQTFERCLNGYELHISENTLRCHDDTIVCRSQCSAASDTDSNNIADLDSVDRDGSPLCTGTGSDDPMEEPQSKQTSRDMLVQKLRDIVAHCILPSRGQC